MYFRLANFSLPLLAGACMAVALSIEAQQPATNAGQSIIFSSPDNGGVSSNLASLATQSSSPLNFQDNFQSASSVPAFDNTSAAPPPVPDEGRPLQRRLEQRRDWVFMTPAEILGITTPEKILHIQERDAVGQPKNLMPIERYNERQLTKNAAPNNNLFANPGESSVWSKSADLSAPLPAPNPVQQTDMDQFRQWLERGLPPATATTLAPGGTTFFQPLANPAGASFTPLSSGIGKPAGLKSLSGVTGQAGSQSAFTPSLAPQSPPWMSQTLQPFVVPQRKF